MNGNRFRPWILVIGVLLILGLAAYQIVSIVRRSAQQAEQAIRPVNDVTSGLATQISQVLHPTPTILPDPVTIIHSVRSLARLETIQYSVEKVIVAESGQGPFGFLFGDRLLLVAHGVVIAGIDLEQIKASDFRLEQGVLYVTMPEPQIFIATLDNEYTYIYDRERGVLTRGDIHLETAARQAAEEEIGKAAVQDGILDQARQNAENYLIRLLRDLGYPEVVFIQPVPED